MYNVGTRFRQIKKLETSEIISCMYETRSLKGQLISKPKLYNFFLQRRNRIWNTTQEIVLLTVRHDIYICFIVKFAWVFLLIENHMVENDKPKCFSLFDKTYKAIYLSKALTCMKFFLYKQNMLFYKGDGYLWPHCCMNILYISHRSLYAPTYSF